MQITGLAQKGHGTADDPYVVIDLGPQPTWKEIDEHIARFGVDEPTLN